MINERYSRKLERSLNVILEKMQGSEVDKEALLELFQVPWDACDRLRELEIIIDALSLLLPYDRFSTSIINMDVLAEKVRQYREKENSHG